MNDPTIQNNSAEGELQVRQPTQRAPIQWPAREESVQQQTDRDRAAAIARQRVERTYSAQGEPNTVNAPVAEQIQQQRYSLQQTPTAQTNPYISTKRTMREEPYDWNKYHSAWQQYYHQYFYSYYAGWWQQQQEQLPAHQQPADTSSQQSAPAENERTKIANELRQKVRTKVEGRAKKLKSSSHFKPIIASFAVGAAFLLLNYNQVLVGAVKQYVAPGSVVTTPVIVEPNDQVAIGPEPKIIIPKIGVEAPVVYDVQTVDEPSYQKGLERGVVRLGTTANPGTKGNVVIGGHSSNNFLNAGKFKYVFVNLKQLDVGDIFYLNYEGIRYTYKITLARHIVSPTDTSVLAPSEKPIVTLFTCDPPGTNVNRLIVQAEQIDPSPNAAPENIKAETNVNKNNPLPSVAPSIWDRVLNIF